MNRTIILISSLALLAAVSCQKSVIQRQADGQVTIKLENSPIVHVQTRADASDVNTDEFNVNVSSDDATFSYIYKDMPEVITVPVGYYTVSAESVTETESLTLPDAWGQVRYAGISERKKVEAGTNPTSFELTCTMVNTAVSIYFGENISKHFEDYKITAYTVESRKLEYTPENTVGENAAVGYFSSGTSLNYVFTGTYVLDNEPLTITGSKSLSPATHLHLTFEISEQNRTVGKPTINVVTDCENLYETITVDPSDGGSFVTE